MLSKRFYNFPLRVKMVGITLIFIVLSKMCLIDPF